MYRFLLFICLFSSSSVFSAPIICPENRCVAVVDAGKSGSKLHVYSFDLDESNAPVAIKNIYSKKIEPGLASIQLNQKSVNQYLSLLFSDLPNVSVPVYFYATSGLRMLDFSRQQAYYDKLSQWFSMQTRWQLVAAKTLKSRDEALYGWLAVNYELGTLTSPSEPLAGMIDSGSGSVQVAFPLNHVQAINPNDYIDFDVYKRHVSLFTHGFLGLGQDEIRNQYLDSGACFPRHYPLPNGLSANGDLQSCSRLINPLINEIHQVDSTVHPVLENNPGQNWYIIGGVSAMVQERPFTFEQNTFTSQELAEKADHQVCQQDWAVLGTLYPKNKYLFANCLTASYFYSLLTNGLGIDPAQPVHYVSDKTSTNDWTLGAVLYQKGAVTLK